MELAAQKRDITGKGVEDLRKQGTLPAVVYGAEEDSVSIAVSQKEFEHVFGEAGESNIIKLSIDGAEKNVLINSVDRDPVTHKVRHVDFYVVQKGQKVEIAVPIEFSGVAPAVKELGANIVKVLHEVEVKAEATNLPQEFVIDISSLNSLESSVLAKDIHLPSGVELVTDPEETVVVVTAAAEEESEDQAEEPDMEAIGLSEERGKKEDADGGASEEASTNTEEPKEQ